MPIAGLAGKVYCTLIPAYRLLCHESTETLMQYVPNWTVCGKDLRSSLASVPLYTGTSLDPGYQARQSERTHWLQRKTEPSLHFLCALAIPRQWCVLEEGQRPAPPARTEPACPPACPDG